MLTFTAILLILATSIAFFSSAQLGAFMVFLSAPVIAMTWDVALVGILTPTRIFGVVVPLMVGLRVLASSRQYAGIPLLGAWAAYSWYALVPAAVASLDRDLLSGVDVSFRTFNGIVGYVLLQACCSDRESFRKLLLVVMAAGLVPMAIVLYQAVTGVVWRVHTTVGLTRLVGIYHDSQTVRTYVFQTLTALILYWAYYRPSAFRQLLLLAYASVCALVLFKTYSKAGNVIAVAWVLIWAVGRRQILPAVVVIGGVLLANVVYYDQIWTETEELFSKELAAADESQEGELSETTQERTLAGRWVVWGGLLEKYAERSALLQLLGGGSSMRAHNDYLGALMEGGLVGLGLYVFLLVSIGARIARNYRRDRSPLNVMAVMLFAMWIIDSLGLVPRAYPNYQWFVWGFIGLALRGIDWRTAAERSGRSAPAKKTRPESEQVGPARRPEGPVPQATSR